MSIHAFRTGRSDGAPRPGHALPLNLDGALTPRSVERHVKMFGVAGYERNGVVLHAADASLQTVLLRIGRERFAQFNLLGRLDVGYDGVRQPDDFQGNEAFFLGPDRQTTLFGYDPRQLPEVRQYFERTGLPVLAVSLDGLERVIARR